MFDIGWPELFVILVVALLVIGPKDLPRALYTVGKWVRTARRMTGEFQKHIDDMVRDTELEEVRKGLNKAQQFNIKKQIENTVDPKGELTGAFDPARKADPAAKRPVAEAEPPRSGISAEADGTPPRPAETAAAAPAPADAAPARDKTA